MQISSRIALVAKDERRFWVFNRLSTGTPKLPRESAIEMRVEKAGKWPLLRS
jgi:hypothetical protein